MPAFLVTGNPGSGKSALARELIRRGLLAVDPDHDPQLSHWEDTAGHQVSGPERPDEQWLSAASPATRMSCWAKDHGITVSDRGRIPARVADQYDAGH